MEWSTAAADLLLAAACVGAVVWLLRQPNSSRRYAAIGMALMALAAGLGTARFAGLASLESLHRGVSHLAGDVAPGCFALVAVALSFRRRRRLLDVGLGALVLGWVAFDVVLDVAIYRTIVGSIAIVILMGVAVRERSIPGALLGLGSLGIALAGLVIGTKGVIGPLLAIDVFHVVLAAAHLLVAYGLVHIAAADGAELGRGTGC